MALSTAPSLALSTSTTTTPTATSLLAVTTPFVEPANCGEALLTSSLSEKDRYGDIITYTSLQLDDSDPRFMSCQPSGWVNVVPASRFSFSPAVCTQSWTAWWLGRNTVINTSATSTSTQYVTTGFCCAPNYRIEPSPVHPTPTQSCSRLYTSLRINGTFTETLMPTQAFLPAWHVSWEASNTPTMSPRPPEIGADQTIISWAEGSSPVVQTPQNYNAPFLDERLFWFLVIGLPLLFLVAVGGCVAWCCVSRRRRKRRVAVVGDTRTPKGSNTTSMAS